MNNTLIAPSLLAADFLNLGDAIDMVNNSQADWFHLDVMDGRFVPNISYGMPIIKAIKQKAKKPLDTHLMIVEPDKYIEDFADCGCDILTVHYEACTHLHRTLAKIKECGMKAGVSLNPHTSIAVLEDIIGDVDVLLLMSVNPGFGGQKFIQNTYDKIQKAKALIDFKNASTLIEIDGGVNLDNAPKLVQYGADVLVAGSSVFSQKNPQKIIEVLKNSYL